MAKKKMKPLLVIAGAGAGKTYDMIDVILNDLPELSPFRFMAVVTYTNAAASEIRQRLQMKTDIPKNVFIGTIHSFFIKFIITPYAFLFNKTPQERFYVAADLKFEGVPTVKAAKRRNLIEAWQRKGVIPHEHAVSITKELLEEEEKVNQSVCRRLQFVFVDEFQDTDTKQAKIFKKLLKGNETKVYAVGDPEQYIMGFTYINKPGNSPKYKNIPINKFVAERTENKNNWRSVPEIVRFANQFHSFLDQDPNRDEVCQNRIHFIMSTQLDEIIACYRNIPQELDFIESIASWFYLTKENKTLNSVAAKHGLQISSNDSGISGSLLVEAVDLILIVLGRNKKQFFDEYKMNIFELRSLGVNLIRKVQKQEISEKAELVAYLESKFPNISKLEERILIDDKIGEIKARLVGDSLDVNYHFRSTIHKAKGLEKDAVLVIAKTENELLKWLETDKSKRSEDKNDTCRIGYVAFTRARKFLCIACLKPILKETKEKIESLGVQIYSSSEKKSS